jgi:hypothetical protein
VACRSAALDCSDPQKSICDATKHICRGCQANSECASLVCDGNFGSTTHGTCLDPSHIVYVNAACGITPDGSAGNPYCKIQDGIAAAKASGVKNVVHVASANYVENLILDFNVTLVGDPGAEIQATGNNNAVAINGMNVTVTLYGLQIAGANGKSPVTCTNIANNQNLNVLSCNILGGGFGIDGQNCLGLNVDSSVIAGNPGGGIQIGGSATITNNFISENGVSAGTSAGGIRLAISTGPATSVDIINNTIAHNLSGTVVSVAVDCATPAAVTLVNNILFGNRNTNGISESQCPMQMYECTDDRTVGTAPTNVDLSSGGSNAPAFVNAVAIDYHLQSSSPCIAKAALGSIVKHDIDGQPRPDPTTMTDDIGADQYYP